MVYSDDIRLRYTYGIYFSSKTLSYIPRIYLKYNVRKSMVGRSEDVSWTFVCSVKSFGALLLRIVEKVCTSAACVSV